jgi:hypothetical protein
MPGAIGAAEDDGAGVEPQRFQHRRQPRVLGVVDEDELRAEADVALRGGQQEQQAGGTTE